MEEFRIDFAQQMAMAGEALLSSSPQSQDRARAVIYVSLLACEIALKSALERTGKSIKDIVKLSHSLDGLLSEVCKCSINVQIAEGLYKRVSAMQIRGLVVDEHHSNATVGNLLNSENDGASRFPNEIRYGSILTHYPAEVISELANKVVSWVKIHNTLGLRPKTHNV